MSNIDKQALREAAATAKIAGEAPVMPFDQRITALNDFMKQCTPATVLALLDELERKEEQRANWFQMAQKLGSDLDAAEKRIAELGRKEQHSDRQSVIDALASSGEEWSDIEEYMQKWDAERASADGKGE
ncbi:ead/Ea22-like family protein [Enterobacter asburiae]|nr:ead/Ea22-like family protein [Enterobacter asburiae]MCE1340509.1 ead/Ea22-like family protein [Enterobacter asburiae]OZP69999.1 hypothetical protein CIG53_01725 [Enterobacter asburiae]QBB05927.1 ead/Ea22-like family protein [Enterobacter cloacae]